MAMDYLRAEAALVRAERLAWAARDWDTLSRLYMPLQEARRQRRQRCGEGTVVLDLVAQGPGDHLDPLHVVQNFPHGQLIVAGWGSTAPAAEVRGLAAKHELYVETFLAAAYPLDDGGEVAVVLVPLESMQPLLPPPEPRSLEALAAAVPNGCVTLTPSSLPAGSRKGSTQTYAEVMALWERLHTPFLQAADREADAIARMEGYRKTIAVDYACELAHQRLSDVAKGLARVHELNEPRV